jgi:GntR family transcriptional regulator
MNSDSRELPESTPRRPKRKQRHLAARRLYSLLRLDLLQGKALPETEAGFPDELAIMSDYNSSRDAVRDALATLKIEGLIERRRGVGTRQTGATTELDSVPLTPEILLWEHVPTPPPIRAILEPSESDTVLCIDYVLHSAERPVAAFTNYVRFEEADGLDPNVFESGFRVGPEADEPSESYDLVLQSMPANPLIAEILDVRQGSPVLWFEQLIRDDQGAVINVATASFRPEVRFGVPNIYRGTLSPIVSLFLAY